MKLNPNFRSFDALEKRNAVREIMVYEQGTILKLWHLYINNWFTRQMYFLKELSKSLDLKNLRDLRKVHQ